MIAASAILRMPTPPPSESYGRSDDPARAESPALAWARLVLRPDVLPRATLGQALLAQRLAEA
jgi:hypothetical protein